MFVEYQRARERSIFEAWECFETARIDPGRKLVSKVERAPKFSARYFPSRGEISGSFSPRESDRGGSVLARTRDDVKSLLTDSSSARGNRRERASREGEPPGIEAEEKRLRTHRSFSSKSHDFSVSKSELSLATTKRQTTLERSGNLERNSLGS